MFRDIYISSTLVLFSTSTTIELTSMRSNINGKIENYILECYLNLCLYLRYQQQNNSLVLQI